MLIATLRGMVAHKLRLALTTASIALGVAFLAGTLMLTDTLDTAFSQHFATVTSGTDAVVRSEAPYASTDGVGTLRPPIDAAVLDRVRAVPGVAVAEGGVSGYALLTDTEGEPVAAAGGAPTMGYSLPDDVALRGGVRLLTGRAPAGPTEVAIDATSSEAGAIPLGSDISILLSGPTRTFTVVGTVAYGDDKDLGGTTGAYFDTATAQDVLGQPAQFDELLVRSTGSVTDTVLTERLTASLPSGTEALTGAAVAKEAADAVADDFAIVGVLLAAFAAVALFVGSFIIWNTFTMIVTQRSREIALLRAVGATRRQVLGNLLAEATVIGVAASAVGLALGAGVAKGLDALMGVVGFDLPTTSLQVQPRTLVVSMLVGTVVTVVAALVPARRATQVLPVEALRAATPGASAPSRVRAVLGSLTASGGVTAVLVGLYGDGGTGVVGLGLLGVLVGVLVLAPLGARPLAAALGAPLQLLGVPGDLARDNATRNPRRTASTATALMVGLALVVGMGVFAASLKASFGPLLDEASKADLYVTGASVQADGISPEVGRLVAQVPGVATTSATGWGEARFDGAEATYSSLDPATVDEVLDLEVVSGAVGDLGTDGLLVPATTAAEQGWAVGDRIEAEFPTTGATTLQLRGTYEGTGFVNGYLISLAAHEVHVPDRLDVSVLVTLERGADAAAVQDDISTALDSHPDARVLTADEFGDDRAGFVDQLLAFVTVMLLLAVVIALLGIVNTLALSVHERTRELGLLRAVGMTTGQVRAMVRWEAVVISLLGGAAGATLGLGLGAALAQSLDAEGITQVSVPVLQVAGCLVLAVLAGVVAAVGPARSASRVDVLRAVVTD